MQKGNYNSEPIELSNQYFRFRLMLKLTLKVLINGLRQLSVIQRINLN